jgi:DNA primase
MQIQEIKTNLSLEEVLQHYNLPIDKNKMLLCPFHEDKTASLQVNLQKNLYKCHACGKKGDVIQFVQDYENLNKHEALVKCTSLIDNGKLKIENSEPTTINHQPSTLFLQKMYLSFRKGLLSSPPAKEYCRSRSLDFDKLEIGFNSGQFHHGERKEEKLIENCLSFGLLTLAGTNSRTGGQAYKPFGNKCILFPLKNCHGQTVSFYFRSTINNDNAKHFYLKNRQGLYPNYPNPKTKKLILTESIIDCASLLQIDEINKNYSLLACYGTNGLNEEIQNAIKELQELEEIIFAFDNDQAGKEAVTKYANQLKMNNEKLKITSLDLPNKDINETLQLHNQEIFIELLENRKKIKEERKEIIFSSEELPTTEEPPASSTQHPTNLEKISQLISKSGIIGEENSSKLLFLIAISYKNKNPLHGIVQGSSGSGKTHLISKIIAMMPQEDVLRFTRITESSLYNYGEYDLCGKIILIEDLDGLKEDALYALRELISNQSLSSLTSVKDKKGNNNSKVKSVKGQFSSLSATTKGELYEDNMNRSFVLAVDESEAQTEKIIYYQNQKIGGLIDEKEEEKAIEELQKIVRNLQCYEVNNPYATQIQLPSNVKNKRRLNEMFQSIVKQITIVNQNQRTLTKDEKLITKIEDIEAAVEILFESIILKIDELDGSLRQFLEKIKKSFKDQDFNRFDAMEVTGFKKSQLQVYLNELVRYGYLKQTGHPNKGFKYKLSYNDDIQKVRDNLKAHFTEQVRRIKAEASGSQTETKPTENQ